MRSDHISMHVVCRFWFAVNQPMQHAYDLSLLLNCKFGLVVVENTFGLLSIFLVAAQLNRPCENYVFRSKRFEIYLIAWNCVAMQLQAHFKIKCNEIEQQWSNDTRHVAWQQHPCLAKHYWILFRESNDVDVDVNNSYILDWHGLTTLELRMTFHFQIHFDTVNTVQIAKKRRNRFQRNMFNKVTVWSLAFRKTHHWRCGAKKPIILWDRR